MKMLNGNYPLSQNSTMKMGQYVIVLVYITCIKVTQIMLKTVNEQQQWPV